MAEALKNVYNLSFYKRFLSQLHLVIPDLNTSLFLEKVIPSDWEQKELKERMRHTADVLALFLPTSFDLATPLLKKFIQNTLNNPVKGDSFVYLFLADYIERYGIDDYKNAIPLLELATELASCEFAVRPFIVRYPQQMMQQMTLWSMHHNHHVRRLATEGCRPRLPWAMALPIFKKNPTEILLILENLKNDPSEYVRKSVANNLNDISKDNPEVFFTCINKWKGLSKETDWIIKHGSRTLLKQGHPEIIQYYGLNQTDCIQVSDFELKNTVVTIGQTLEFLFNLENKDLKSHYLRIEYAIYYRRQNDTLSKKVFKISEKKIAPSEVISITRKQSFRIITTRKFYPGEQQISIIINGEEKANKCFLLV